MLLFGIVAGLRRQGMVDANRIVDIVRHLVLAEAVLVLVEIQHQIPERTVEHLPRTLPEGGCKESTTTCVIGVTVEWAWSNKLVVSNQTGAD